MQVVYQFSSIFCLVVTMMRKFLGLAPTESRKRKSVEEKNKEYDVNKRKRTIVPSWKTEFTWLVTDDTKQIIYCQICRAVYAPLAKKRQVNDKFSKYGQGPFVVGCKNLRHDALTTHDQSEGHKYACEIYKGKTSSPGESIAEKTVQKLNQASFDKLDKLFRGAHAIAKKNRPISDFKWMCELDTKKGLDIGSKYDNADSCKEFIIAIAETERKKIEAALIAAKFCTIMSDGSTDIGVIENEIVYVHFARHGEPHCYFLGLIETERANAIGIYSAIMKALKFSELSQETVESKIIGFAGDGASVNTGELNGVIAHFRQKINPAIVMVKCMSHRVELAYKDAMKPSLMFQKVHTLLDELFKFFHKSPKQMAALKSEMKDHPRENQVQPLRVGGTRWITHFLSALQNLWKGYKAIISHLNKVSKVNTQSATQSKAKYLLKTLSSRKVIVFAHFITDLAAVLSQLSLTLQKRETCMYQVHEHLQTTLLNLKKIETRPGPNLRAVLDCDQFHGVSLQGEANCSGQMSAVIQKVIDSLKQRFSDTDKGVLSGTKVADLESWPATFDEAVDFGDDKLAGLVDHFRDILETQGVDICLIEVEWTLLKQHLYKNHKVHEMSWKQVNEQYRAQCANILDLVDLLLSLPAGSAECERGFSQMKIVKTQYRNRLKSTTMTLLMTVQMNSADIELYDPNPAIHQWNLHRHRRPDFMTHTKKCSVLPSVPDITDQDDSDQDVAVVLDVQSAASETSRNYTGDSDYGSDFSDLEEQEDAGSSGCENYSDSEDFSV